MKLKQLLVAVGALVALPFAQSALANEHGVALKHAEISVSDQEQIRRGLLRWIRFVVSIL